MLAAVPVVLALHAAPAEPLEFPSPPAGDYRLTWSAPEGCPDAATIEARIAALTEGRRKGEGTLEVQGEVRELEDRFALRLTTSLRGITGTRELTTRTCAELGESVALVVAISLDPALAGPVSVPEPEGPDDATHDEPNDLDPFERQAPEPIAPDDGETLSDDDLEGMEPAPDRVADDRRPVAGTGVLLRAGLGPELGALPGPTAALRLAVGMHWPHARVLLEGTYLTPRRADGPGGSAALYQQGTVAALGCARLGPRPWSVPLCGGIEAGGLRADGRGLRTPNTVLGPWLGPVARVGALREIGPVGLWLELEGVARVIATRVVIDQQLAFRPSVGSLRLLAGFEIGWR